VTRRRVGGPGRFLVWLLAIERRFALVLGISDGILTALMLVAGRLARPGTERVSMDLALRVAVFALASGALTFFVARLTEVRQRLTNAERQLNIVTPGRLARTDLGRHALIDAVEQTAIASGASFAAALTLVGFAAAVPGATWLSIMLSLALLAGTGLVIGRSVHGAPLTWMGGLIAGGVVVSALGIWLNLA
jgi:hypothetical protein